MFGMIVNAEVTADDLRHAGSRPQVIGPTVAGSPRQQKGFQLTQLLVGETGRSAQGLGIQTAGCAGLAQPAVNRATINAENLGDGGGILPLADRRDGALAPM